MAAARSTAAEQAKTTMGRRMTKAASRDQRLCRWSSACLGTRKANAPHAASPEQRQERWLQRECGDDRHERNHQARKAERADERHRDDEDHREADGDGDAREDHRPPCSCHRGHDGVLDCSFLVGKLVSEPVHDQERVVDRDPESDELDEVRDIEHHQELVREGENDRQRGRCRAGGHSKWNQEGDGGTEDEGQQRQRGQDSDDLAPVQVSGQDRFDVVLERRGSGHVRARGGPRPSRRGAGRPCRSQPVAGRVPC